MPTRRGRNQLEQASGTMPRRANTNPNRAAVLARRMSIGSVIVTPTPTAAPLIAPITGLVHSKIRSETRPAAVARHPHVGLHVGAASGERVAARSTGRRRRRSRAPRR
jgi:hypothetical protein